MMSIHDSCWCRKVGHSATSADTTPSSFTQGGVVWLCFSFLFSSTKEKKEKEKKRKKKGWKGMAKWQYLVKQEGVWASGWGIHIQHHQLLQKGWQLGIIRHIHSFSKFATLYTLPFVLKSEKWSQLFSHMIQLMCTFASLFNLFDFFSSSSNFHLKYRLQNVNANLECFSIFRMGYFLFCQLCTKIYSGFLQS